VSSDIAEGRASAPDGEQTTEGAKDLAREENAAMILDGRVAFWEQALERALAG